MKAYFRSLEEEAKRLYEVAAKARSQGKDPAFEPEIPLAKDLAGRVEGLVGPRGVADRIRELSAKLSKEEVALEVAREIVKGKFGEFSSPEEAAEQAIRTALAVLTEGIVAAPLEGIVKVRIKKNYDNTRYLAIYFAGPIRSAGGSAQALAVLTGDYVRHALGLDRFKPTEEEIERFAEETDLYNSEASRLQYLPSAKEVRHAIRNIPVEITGEGTDRIEVSGYRNLERVETNQVRGGGILVLAEGVLQKAPKLLKYVDKFRLPGWDWLKEYGRAKSSVKSEGEIMPSEGFIKDLIAGRPVLSHPSAQGGLRLRYGRSRNSGFASACLHPATMSILDDFIAIGTQIKTERPGKAAAVTPCDSIDGPIVKLLDGSVVRIESLEEARRLRQQVEEVLYLGDILVGYGDFLENNHPLMPSGYVEEWWIQELERAAKDKAGHEEYLSGRLPDPGEAVRLSEELGVPMHPRYTYYYSALSKEELRELRQWLSTGRVVGGKFILDMSGEKHLLERLGVPHRVFKDSVIIEEYDPLLRSLGLHLGAEEFMRAYDAVSSPLELVNSFGIEVRDKAPTFIGARMGRPEKAKERKMQPAVNVLFPVGQYGGRTRDVKKAAQKDRISVEVARRWCPNCRDHFITTLCPRCGEHTELQRACNNCGRPSDGERCRGCGGLATFYHTQEVRIKSILRSAVDRVGDTPKELKGVIGMTSAYKIPEPLEKGLLRSRHGVYVFKDGTTRFDATDAPLTHFTPAEVGVEVGRLRELGYTRDYTGKPLKSPDQVLELKCQDVILPEEAGEYLLRTSRFIDDLLVKFYGLEPYYRARDKEDLVGHLIVGLAPHTSAAILGRIIGFTKAKTCYAHPYFHAAKRRNCLPPGTEILVLNHGHAKLLTLEEIYRRGQPGEVVDDFGTARREVDLLTMCIDPATGEFKTRKIKSVIRSPAPRHLISIKTSSGRTITASPGHRLVVASTGGLCFKKAVELDAGDTLLVPAEINVPEDDIKSFDLLAEFSKIQSLRREATVWEAEIVEQPIIGDGGEPGVFEDFSGLGKDHRGVSKCLIGFEGDAAGIPRVIEVSPELMRFIGYYLAAGNAGPASEGCTVNISSVDRETQQDILSCVERTFRLKPRITRGVVSISSRAVYHFLTDVLRMGGREHEKRIPSSLLSLPLDKIRELLEAYLRAAGVEKDGQLLCSPASPGLLRDVGFMLHRLGIPWEIRPSPRRRILAVRSNHAGRLGAIHRDDAPRSERMGSMLLDRVEEVAVVKSEADYLYDVEVEDYHNFLAGDFILSGNCDGDEDAFFLLLDGLLNFSKAYLPSSRGGKMDAPLVLTTTLDPNEVDDEAHNMDVVERYPLEFYEATLRYARPQEVKELIETVADRIGTPEQYRGLRFTHPTSDISQGPRVSAYKTLGAMMEKVQHQLALAKKIRAVDETDVARRVVEGHFLPDLTGNLRAFSKQTMRCVNCNAKYRRIPLRGVCRRCSGKLVLTVSKGSVEKYLQITKGLIDTYNLDNYLRQRIRILEMSISSVFEDEGVKQVSLSDFI
jgi:DNA polymerase II large subunit